MLPNWTHIGKPIGYSKVNIATKKEAGKIRWPQYLPSESVTCMDTSEIRHRNFMALFKRFKEQRSELPNRGMLKLFSEKIELSDRYLSHIKNNRKNIGAATARQIEKRLKLPHGYMDVPHDSADPTNELERNFIDTALALYRSSPADARALMVELLRKRLGKARE